MKAISIASTVLLFLGNQVVGAEDVSFGSGLAVETNKGLIECGKGSRPSKVGTITAADSTVWSVPAENNFEIAMHAFDLYNECDDITPNSLSEVDLDSVPVVDAKGSEVFTAFIFADNYFEFYANGKLIAVDAVPFTPFNSSVLKFSASRPVTIAIMGVDWEENLGLGSEAGRGKKYQPGDAGVVALVVDQDKNIVSITDSHWKAQTFYTSPLDSIDCITQTDGLRDSSSCSTKGTNSPDGLSAAFWPIPENWEQPEFDASSWPAAHTFTNSTVGVDNKPAYTNFTDIFDGEIDAQFIWSSNLVLDNLVLLRTVIQ